MKTEREKLSYNKLSLYYLHRGKVSNPSIGLAQNHHYKEFKVGFQTFNVTQGKTTKGLSYQFSPNTLIARPYEKTFDL